MIVKIAAVLSFDAVIGVSVYDLSSWMRWEGSFGLIISHSFANKIYRLVGTHI